MQQEYLLIFIIILGFVAILYLINKKLSSPKPESDETLTQWLRSMQASLETTNKTLNEAMRNSSSDMTKTLQENSRQLNDRLDKAATVIGNVSREVGAMSEIGRGMRELQDFLKSPKLRGNIGEQVLKDMIGQIFPKNSFHLQYQFSSGEKVDAAIQTDAGILPIDSKFPMENFQKMAKAENEETKINFQKEFYKDIKRHIDVICKKYVLPEEGTMDFALMYVPSESVYYEVVNQTDLTEYARTKRIYIVSPSTLYMNLQTILLSFEGKKIEARSKEVFRLLRALQADFRKIDENMSTLGRHIGNASAQFHNVTTSFSQMGQKLQSTKNIEEKMTEELPPPQQLEKI